MSEDVKFYEPQYFRHHGTVVHIPQGMRVAWIRPKEEEMRKGQLINPGSRAAPEPEPAPATKPENKYSRILRELIGRTVKHTGSPIDSFAALPPLPPTTLAERLGTVPTVEPAEPATERTTPESD